MAQHIDSTTDTYLKAESLQHPLIHALSDMAYEFANIRLVIVFPKTDGWGQVRPDSGDSKPDFCSLIQKSKEGARHCRMCHILMSIAACTNNTTEQKCHAGASVLAVPVGKKNGECFSILSTCVFTGPQDAHAFEEIRERTANLGLKAADVKSAFNSLPALTEEQIQLARAIMKATGEAVNEVSNHALLAVHVSKLHERRHRKPDVAAEIEEQLRNFASAPPAIGKTTARSKKKGAPALVGIVSELVERRPNMPFSVSEIAAAARMTPNHFSSLFHKFKGQSFSSFLTEQRIRKAKELLPNLTLNITEVANASGYDDPGYFARVFKRETGMSPRDWRESLDNA